MILGQKDGFKQFFFFHEVDILLEAGKEFRMNLSVSENIDK